MTPAQWKGEEGAQELDCDSSACGGSEKRPNPKVGDLVLTEDPYQRV